MRRVHVISVGLMVLTLGLGAIVLQSCGGGDDKRTRERCEVCDGHVDEDCRRECRRFCLPDEDCEERCTFECDQCKKDLSCQACAGDCAAGAQLRCAPLDEVISCEDGAFGEGPEASPAPTPTTGRTATPGSSPSASVSQSPGGSPSGSASPSTSPTP